MARVTTLLVAAFCAMSLAEGRPQFRSGVHAVELNVTVLVGKRLVKDLQTSDFEVRDNDVAQPLVAVSLDAQAIDLTVLVDMSETQGRNLVAPVGRAIGRIRGHLRPVDRVSIVTFGGGFRTLAHLVSADEAANIRPGTPADWGTHSALYDALGDTLATPTGAGRRHVVIVFADGGDGGSFLSDADVLDLAARSHVVVFAVTRVAGTSWERAAFPRAINEHPDRQPIAFFERLTAMTGGRLKTAEVGIIDHPSGNALTVRRNANLLDGALTDAIDDFRSSYTLRYTLSADAARGWHDVKVSVRHHADYLVRTRTGYRVD